MFDLFVWQGFKGNLNHRYNLIMHMALDPSDKCLKRIGTIFAHHGLIETATIPIVSVASPKGCEF